MVSTAPFWLASTIPPAPGPTATPAPAAPYTPLTSNGIGRRGAEGKAIAHSPDRDRIGSAVEHQRAAAARAAHDKTGLDNVKADAAEVGVDGREPGASYSQSYQCSTNGG